MQSRNELEVAGRILSLSENGAEQCAYLRFDLVSIVSTRKIIV